MLIESKQHKQINGNLDGKPFEVVFDSDGRAEVEESVGEFLLGAAGAKRIIAPATPRPNEQFFGISASPVEDDQTPVVSDGLSTKKRGKGGDK